MSNWGILKTVRPAKYIRSLLLSGYSVSEAEKEFMAKFEITEEKAKLASEVAVNELKLINKTNPNDICLYIGIPFCKTRCLYCSFITSTVGTNKLIPEFFDALIKELEATSEIIKECNLRIISVYVGGGTPTVLEANMLDKLFEKCYNLFDFSNVCEFTVEAGRPDTIDEEKLLVMKKHKVTRISINPQTMNDKTLKIIGRNHTADDIIASFEQAKKCGFDNINADIICGLPSETIEDFNYTLDSVLSLKPKSITVHTMSIKRGSWLREKMYEYNYADGKLAELMVNTARNKLKSFGYNPYYMYRQKNMLGDLENIGYSLEGFECLYNIIIMEELLTIISVGGGGVTKTVNPNTGLIERIYNVKEPKDYIERIDEMIQRKYAVISMLS